MVLTIITTRRSGTLTTKRSTCVYTLFLHHPRTSRTDELLQVLDSAKFQLGLWGIQYFDLYLVHFPVSLEHVKREDKYPPEWWGLDGKVHPGE